MNDGYEKIGKVLREGIHGEEIEFIQYDDTLEKIYLKVKSGRVITIEIESDDPESFFNLY